MRFLIAQIHLTQGWHYALTVLFVFALTFCQQAIEQAFSEYEEHVREHMRRRFLDYKNEDVGKDGNVSWGEQAIRAVFLVPRLGLGFLVMQIIMTMDVGFFFAALGGGFFGFFLLRRRVVYHASVARRRKDEIV